MSAKRLGGYVRMSISDRREAVADLMAEGMSGRQVADVLGVDESTIREDKRTAEDPAAVDEEVRIPRTLIGILREIPQTTWPNAAHGRMPCRRNDGFARASLPFTGR